MNMKMGRSRSTCMLTSTLNGWGRRWLIMWCQNVEVTESPPWILSWRWDKYYQNKNTTVLKLAVWLRAAGYFKFVNFIFLVVWHTQNTADWLFHSLKHDYPKQNIFRMEDLIDRLNQLELVTVIPTGSGNFCHLATSCWWKAVWERCQEYFFLILLVNPTIFEARTLVTKLLQNCFESNFPILHYLRLWKKNRAVGTP